MICEKCGVTNNPEAKFCIGCGKPLNTQNPSEISMYNLGSMPNSIKQNSEMQVSPNMQTMQEQTTTISMENTSSINNIGNNVGIGSITIKTCFLMLISILLKPYTALKEESKKFTNFKNSFILALFITIFGVLINLIQTIWSVIRVISYDYGTHKKITKFVFENLKEIKFIKVIGQNFLIYLGIIFVIACVFYIAGLIIKKQLNFSKLLGIATTAIVPILLSILLLSPIFGMISNYLATGITIFGGIYTFLLIYEGMNEELKLQGNQKYYFNLICLFILGFATYYLYMKFFLDVGSDLSDLLDLFK